MCAAAFGFVQIQPAHLGAGGPLCALAAGAALRLMPYKLNKDKKRAPMFYAGLVMVANDLNTWENEGKFDEKARTDRR